MEERDLNDNSSRDEINHVTLMKALRAAIKDENAKLLSKQDDVRKSGLALIGAIEKYSKLDIDSIFHKNKLKAEEIFDFQDSSYSTPLMIAIVENNFNIVNAILSHAPKKIDFTMHRFNKKECLLMRAVKNKNTKMIKSLLKKLMTY